MKDSIHTEKCKCGHTAVQHSICSWLPPDPETGRSLIGPCFCNPCHEYESADENGMFKGWLKFLYGQSVRKSIRMIDA